MGSGCSPKRAVRGALVPAPGLQRRAGRRRVAAEQLQWRLFKEGEGMATSMRVSLAALLVSLLATPVAGQEAKELYEKRCVSCHGASGKGDGPVAQKLKSPPADLA